MILGLCIASGAGAPVWSCKIRLPCREGEKEGEGGREREGGGGGNIDYKTSRTQLQHQQLSQAHDLTIIFKAIF